MSTGFLCAGGRFVAMKERESKSGFFSVTKYPFYRCEHTMEVDPTVRDYSFSNCFDGANEYVKQNADKYCGRLGVSASKLIELIDNGDIGFDVNMFTDKWVVIYWDEKGKECRETIDAANRCEKYDPWDKFAYMYLEYGGNPEILKKFRPLEAVRYSEYQSRGVSIGGRSLLDEMMDKAVQRGVNAMGYYKQEP